MSEEDVLNAMLRSDFSAFVEKVFNALHPGTEFVDNWHIHAITHALNGCIDGTTTRQIITIPPRSLKSICASVAFPAWVLGHDPSKEIICISHSQDLSEKLAMDCRQVMEMAWYKALFPKTRVSPLKNSAAEYVTTEHGRRFATSVGGSLTGRGGDIIIVDDFHKADEPLSEAKRTSSINWYSNTVPSRLNNKETGAIIIVQQRLHEGDLVGELTAQSHWQHLCLPAIAEQTELIPVGPNKTHTRMPGETLHPIRESKETLDELASQLGSITFAAQYQQTPVALEGNIFKEKWITRYQGKLTKYPRDSIVQTWDTASTTGQASDYSVCMTWLVNRKGAYLHHVFRGKLEYPELLQKVYELDGQWGPDLIIIEQSPCSTALIQTVQKKELSKYKCHLPKGDKISRLIQEVPVLEARLVHIRDDKPWFAPLLHELKAFPSGKHDDQMDALTLFLYWYRELYLHQVIPAPKQDDPADGSCPPQSSLPPPESTLNVNVTVLDSGPDLDLSSLY
tara:strand:- start:615 stop:2141 length:1527 start_codon:yes stop_codon:yes gene_type:complete